MKVEMYSLLNYFVINYFPPFPGIGKSVSKPIPWTFTYKLDTYNVYFHCSKFRLKFTFKYWKHNILRSKICLKYFSTELKLTLSKIKIFFKYL